MTKLPKQKRDHLILVCMGTAGMLALIIYALILPQYGSITKTRETIAQTQKKSNDMVDAIKRTSAAGEELTNLTLTLSNAEQDIAAGDPNAWIYDLIRNFNGHYKVEMEVQGQTEIGDVDMLAKFPYKQLKVTVTGTAYYHDLGKFVMEFENTYPHCRIENLTLDPAGNATDNTEKLSFRMDIITLVKSTTTTS